jgi:anti-sigma B factor antagonist
MSQVPGRATECPTAFSITTDETSYGVRLSLRGDLDLASGPELERAALRVRRARPARLVLDLTRLSFLDSCGLRALLAVQRACAQGGPALSVIAGAQARRMFDLTGVTDSLPLADRPAARDGGVI